MDKRILLKLKMEKPAYYDSTGNEITIIQKPILRESLKVSFQQGFKIGSSIGAFVIGISCLLALVTVKEFNSFLNVSGSTWRAIFILVCVIAFVYFLGQLISCVIRSWKLKFGPSAILSKFFKEETIINSRSRKAK